MKTLCLLIASSLFLGCKAGAFGADDGQRPVIDNVTALRSSLLINDTTTITSSARDLNGEKLDYVWTATGGTIETGANTPIILWRAPETQGSYKVTLTVNNESQQKTSKAVTLSVTPVSTPIVEILDPTFGQFIPSTNPSSYIIKSTIVNLNAGSVDSVKCFINGVLLEKQILVKSSNFTWNISGLNGDKTIRVQAWTHTLISGTTTTGFAEVDVKLQGTVGKRK